MPTDAAEVCPKGKTGDPTSLHPEIFRRFPALVRDNVERDLCALAQVTQPSLLDGRDVNEHVLAATAVRLDEPVTLRRIEPLHCSARHVRTPLFETRRQR